MRLPSPLVGLLRVPLHLHTVDLCRGHVSPHSYVRRIWHVSLRSTRHQPPHRHNGIYCPPSGGSAAADTGFAGVFSVSRLFRGPVHLCSQILLTPRLLPCPSARCLPPSVRFAASSLLIGVSCPLLGRTPRDRTDTVAPPSLPTRAACQLASRRLFGSGKNAQAGRPISKKVR